MGGSLTRRARSGEVGERSKNARRATRKCPPPLTPPHHALRAWAGGEKISHSRPPLVIARSDSDEAIHGRSLGTRRPGLLRGACHRTARLRAGPLARNDDLHRSRAALFVRAPRFAVRLHETRLPKGRRSAERRGVDSAVPARQADERLALRVLAARVPLGDALASRRSTAALARGLESPRLSPVPRFMVADNRSAPRAASSWQTGDVAGRASFRTARGQSYEPHPGHRSRSINQPSPVDVPWLSEMVVI